MITEQEQHAIRAQLEEELESVEHQLAEHGASPDEEGPIQVDIDEGFADSAAATAGRSEILSTIEQLRRNRAEVAAALQRMDAGTYGKCERCGQDIPIERLEARPVARLCVNCQQAVS